VTGVIFASGVSETQYETVQLREAFEVISITNDSGEDVSDTTVTKSQAHNDTNYITKEEWNQREQRIEDLIEEYENSTSDGGGGGGGPLIDESALDFGLPGGAVLAGGAALGAYLLGR